MNNTNFAISVDWLQVYTLSSHDFDFTENKTVQACGYTFDLCMSPEQTAMFTQLFEVKLWNLVAATIETKPRSTKLNSRMTLIKLSNRMLYNKHYVTILYGLMEALHVTYKGITRIDLCYDCNYFKDGRSPSRFINNYLLKPATTKEGISRKGSDEFTCHGRKGLSSSSKINYISFGAPTSRVRSYIYDKTIELDEVKDKPWIRETWEENGIISTKDVHVFRSEISIKSQGTDVLNMSTGELFRLSPEYLKNQYAIERLFYIYADKYFYFRINKGQKYVKDFPRLELFERNQNNITSKPIYINKNCDSGRSEQICYNKLDKLSSIYTDLSDQHLSAIHDTMVFLNQVRGYKCENVELKKRESYFSSLKGESFFRNVDKEFWRQVNETYAAKDDYIEQLVAERKTEKFLNSLYNLYDHE